MREGRPSGLLAAIAAAVARDPIEAYYRLRTRLVAWRASGAPAAGYEPDTNWKRGLHEALGSAVDHAADFTKAWQEILRSPEIQGLKIGPHSFGIWNDGDPELLSAVWCLTRILRPRAVVETGVARGFTSRVVLEAMRRNGAGHLWSIDLPPALDRRQVNEIGIAVPESLRTNWTFIEGSSRRRLPKLLSQLGEIDLFIHDSMHTDDNVRFEMNLAWEALRPGGAMVIDDIDLNAAFGAFAGRPLRQRTFICQSEPLRPDAGRSRHNDKGLFGILIKLP
jgi:predicted O-methyltransferase YrrM